ncbi:MAG: 2-C-methyl-D-erythritol 4-phosphate cytidylyltransferase [Nitrospirales bacterium]|nr:2-C-methyl-D-erythritol 4-phosphate cytidylyltransferase [Nitrospirales bacterium]
MPGPVAAIVPAAGIGKRFGADRNKTLFPLLGKPLIAWTLEALQSCPEVTEILLVLKAEDRETGAQLLEEYGISKARKIVTGGAERQDSVLNGIRAAEGASVVLIHDGARPMVDHAIIRRALEALDNADGAVVGVPVKDTIKIGRSQKSEDRSQSTEHGKQTTEEEIFIDGTPDRSALWAIQTPQVFHAAKIRDAYEKAAAEGFYATDDAALMERYGGLVKIVMGSYRNIKVTTPEDAIMAEAFLSGGEE